MDEDGFVRQRRNILVVSLILFFSQGTGLILTELNVLGNKATLISPVSLEPMLWIAWFYLLIRYCQAFNEYGKPKFSTSIKEKFNQLIYHYASGHLHECPAPLIDPPHQLSMQPGNPSITTMKYGGFLKVEALLLFSFENPPHGQIIQKNECWPLPHLSVLLARIKAITKVAIASSVVTELYLPFAVALTPLFQLARKLI
jgi:hypothetical protein